MKIPWGGSILQQVNDSMIAEDFNPNLHEHMKAIRGNKLSYAGPEENEYYHPNEGQLKPTEKAILFINKKHLSKDPDGPAAAVVLTHNRKTGGVVSSTSGGGEYTNSEPKFSTRPSKMSKNIHSDYKDAYEQKKRLE